MKLTLAVYLLLIGSVATMIAVMPDQAFSQLPNPVGCGSACNVSGAGRSCPASTDDNKYKYYCSVSTAGTACGGPALMTSGCIQNSGGCGNQISKATGQTITDPNGFAVPCEQTYQVCASATCPAPAQ